MKNLPQSLSPSVSAPSSIAAALQPFVDCVAGKPPSFQHARKLMHEHGMVQFAQGDRIHLEHGYCLDDNARAFLAAVLSLHLNARLEDARVIGDASLDFVERCRRPDGQFHNLMAEDGSFTDEVGSPESFGRTVWAVGVASRCAPIDEWRKRSVRLLREALEHVGDLTDLRPKAYVVLGLAAAIAPEAASLVPPQGDLPESLARDAEVVLKLLCNSLRGEFESNAQPGWDWWEPLLTWGNARLPEATLRGAAALSDPKLEKIGMRGLAFLAGLTQAQDTFLPIGNAGWYEREKERATHDQQPIEACAMVDLWLAASKLTGRVEYQSRALETFGWFFGLNSERLVMVDARGGCKDGLSRNDFNINMGAESTLSYLHAHAALAQALNVEDHG